MNACKPQTNKQTKIQPFVLIPSCNQVKKAKQKSKQKSKQKDNKNRNRNTTKKKQIKKQRIENRNKK